MCYFIFKTKQKGKKMIMVTMKVVTINLLFLSSVQFSHSVVSDSLWPHEPQHTRPPSPSPTPGVYPNPCPLSRWYHPTIKSSVIPFSSCPQSFSASGSFLMSQLFASGSQSAGVSASTSVLPMNFLEIKNVNSIFIFIFYLFIFIF